MVLGSWICPRAASVLPRVLLLGLVGLLAGCFLNIPNPPPPSWLTPLQNPKYPGDANKDLVPYQARQRDAAECGFSLDNSLKFNECMSARGWKPAD